MPEGERITPAEIEQFAQKLQAWGDELSSKEQALLQLMLAQAKQVEPADVEGYVAATSVKDAAAAALESISSTFSIAPGIGPGAKPIPWRTLVIGPAWVKSLG